MAEDIRQWLEDLGLGGYADAFAENYVDFDVLSQLTNDDFNDIGVTAVGHRRKLLDAIAGLARQEKSQPSLDVEALRRQVTVLFADISGFTTLSSQLDAEEIHTLLNGFFTAVDQVVGDYGGSIDKHIGDAVMAVFGAPVAHTDDPERALRAALDIHEAAAGLQPPLRVHIGVASGQVVASSTGSASHTEYTVTGDSVNLAARLTDMASAGQTFASASVKQAVGDRFIGEDLGQQFIVGMPEPMAVYEFTGIAANRRNLSTFIGRERETQIFETALNRCLESGNGATLVVRGEASMNLD